MDLGKQFLYFLLRWLLNSFGLWVSIRLISGIEFDGSLSVIVLGGLILSLVNAIIKPILLILSLPFIVFSLGLFTIIVNGFAVFIAASLTPGLSMGFWSAVLAGLIIGLINYALTHIIDLRQK